MASSIIRKEIQPCDVSSRIIISITVGTNFIPTVTGTLVCVLTTDSGVTMEPFAQLVGITSDNTSTTISSNWGNTTSGAVFCINGIVKAGLTYRIQANRCSITGTYILT